MGGNSTLFGQVGPGLHKFTVHLLDTFIHTVSVLLVAFIWMYIKHPNKASVYRAHQGCRYV
jgi:hypothetical protein